jgi:hypothetical protein
MKSILTLLTAFVLFGLTFTLSSCKNCSKDRDGNTPSGDNAATLDAGNGKSKTNAATLDAGNGKSKTIPSGDNVATLDVGTGVDRVIGLAKKAKQEEQNAKNAAKRGWDAALVKVVVDASNENKVEETRTAEAEANTAQETAFARKDIAKQLAEIEKVWNIKETDNVGRWRKETIKNAVLETVEALANAEQWTRAAGYAKDRAERVDGENVDASAGARACWGARDAAGDAGVAKGNAEYAADQVTTAVKTYGDAVAAIALGGADGQGVWEAIIDVKYWVAKVKAAYVAAKYYADMAKAFVDKAKERNVWVGWGESDDEVTVAQEHVKEAAEHVKRANNAAKEVL